MSEQEKFLQRWSRRKQEAEKQPKSSDVVEPKREAERPSGIEGAAIPEPAGKEPLDPKILPSLDSISATSDIRAFLAPGVPEELKRAALQRVWRTDPAIRNFIGLSENSWDFNDPAGIHGFGPLQVTQQIKAAVDAMLDGKLVPPGSEQGENRPSDQPPPQRVAELAQRKAGDEIIDQTSEGALEERTATGDIAPQTSTKGVKSDDRTARRGHGAALPK